jgi:hypothetical protein
MTSLRAATTAGSATSDRAARNEFPVPRPGTTVTIVAALTVAATLGFAAVNVVFETTGHIPHSPGARITEQQFGRSVGIAIANWLVTAIKVVGAAVLLLSLARRQQVVRPKLLAGLLWAGLSTLGIYATGNVVEGVGMAAGLTGTFDQIRPLDVGYVLFFLLFAAGFAVVAVSYLRRYRLAKSVALLGALTGPVLLALLLVAMPAIFNALGLLPPA